MKNKNLIYLCFQNQEAEMQSLNNLSDQMEILERGQLHNGHPTAFLLATGALPESCLVGVIDKAMIQQAHKDVLRGYYKLTQVSVHSHLLKVESHDLGEILICVDHLVKQHSYEVIEISRAVRSGQLALAYLANGDTTDMKLYQDRGLKIDLIETPTESQLQLFNIRTK